MKEPFVTIAIPTYSRHELLKDALNSALAQTYPHFEILISHNPGSADDAVIEAWAEVQVSKDSRIRYWKNPVNVGMAGNWNACVDAAKGEFIILLADDDRLVPECLSAMAPHASPEIAVIFSNHYVISANGERNLDATEEFFSKYLRKHLTEGFITKPGEWVWQNAIPIVASLIRTSVARRLRFREELNTPEIEMFARIVNDGGQFYFCEEFLAEYRVHGSQSTSSGLMSERLLSAMAAIQVDPDTEVYKQVFISECARGAISRTLKRGDFLLCHDLLRRFRRDAIRAKSLTGSKGEVLKAGYTAMDVSPRWLVSWAQTLYTLRRK